MSAAEGKQSEVEKGVDSAKPPRRRADRKAEKKDAAIPPATSKYSSERLMTILLAPVVSEKGTFIADKHEQVIFKVDPRATKPEVKAAVELMFKVNVESVQISNVKGKKKRFGQYMGRRRDWKKAYVCLKEGQEINFAAET